MAKISAVFSSSAEKQSPWNTQEQDVLTSSKVCFAYFSSLDESVERTTSESLNSSVSCSTQRWMRESLVSWATEHHAAPSSQRLRKVRAAASRTSELEWSSRTVAISATKVETA